MSEDKCCSLRDGVHDITCPTNNEYEMYRCRICGEGKPQFSISFGICYWCHNKKAEGKK